MIRNQTVCEDESNKILSKKGASLLMFGGEHCGVCQVIWPQLVAQLATRWPGLVLNYIDCEQHQECCAQQGVYSLPVVRLYFDGRLYLEEIQIFSLAPFIAGINELCAQYYEHDSSRDDERLL
ncbi:thioredoxin family protein [Neptunomonas sp.]|uniref:thioredoxin family protein n=1 Tax=Neptunomonas sp. TaxID=1971898 RepID=UPI0025E213AB|nr:thioredoxin family protein [Neptunomonas sp.]